MDFSYDETQRVIAQVTSDVLANAGDDPWKALGEAGMLSLAVPQWLGGEGLGLPEVAVVLTEIGRRATDVPALSMLAMGVLPVATFAPKDVQAELLDNRELTGVLGKMSYRDGGISGVSQSPCAATAYRLLVQVGPRIAVVDPGGDGAVVSPDGVVRLDGAVPVAVFDGDLRRFAIAGVCAMGDGLLRGALELTAAHVAQRKQFGRPLAAFQAVAQQIADVYIASRTMHLAALAACLNAEDVAVAAAWLAREGPPAMRTCHHLHGGLGLDVSYPLHRYSAMLRKLVGHVHRAY
ncbi:acyl-CoA dehydrogenase family protein [Allorhizocola rhizosphaerae]|uniref:acyl-CoA dehydrogenase family protein n=1 Tax=Allorhizocola rhizosphaerae TaxID=1872709 RepID=UPI000E3CB5F1|nr:acyl-CoA dehydrogenase family protein [Allorhizocola rhizosphaerae]